LLSSLYCALVYRRIDDNVYRKSAGRGPTTTELADFHVGKCFSADHHQQYVANNPNGYCGIAGGGRRRKSCSTEGSVVEPEGYLLATSIIHVVLQKDAG
jgi:hypothetical protein